MMIMILKKFTSVLTLYYSASLTENIIKRVRDFQIIFEKKI